MNEYELIAPEGFTARIEGNKIYVEKSNTSDGEDVKKANVSEDDLLELIYWARRYCDNRSTYAPSSFNEIYKRIRSDNPDMIRKDQFDKFLKYRGTFWPYAQDGMFEQGCDAIK